MKKTILPLLLLALVLSGCCLRHDWQAATCDTPKTCRSCGKTDGEALGHSWRAASCLEPEFCRICQAVGAPARGHSWAAATCDTPQTCLTCQAVGSAALGHNWQVGTCETPPTCLNCGAAGEAPAGHSWTEATEANPKTCTLCGRMEPMELPVSGKVFIGRKTYAPSALTIYTDHRAVYVKLKDLYLRDVYSFFVRAQDAVTVAVPAGEFYVYFAAGDQWFGTQQYFGPDTRYFRDDEPCDFKTYSWEYFLEESVDGNFSETPILQEDF